MLRLLWQIINLLLLYEFTLDIFFLIAWKIYRLIDSRLLQKILFSNFPLLNDYLFVYKTYLWLDSIIRIYKYIVQGISQSIFFAIAFFTWFFDLFLFLPPLFIYFFFFWRFLVIKPVLLFPTPRLLLLLPLSPPTLSTHFAVIHVVNISALNS